MNGMSYFDNVIEKALLGVRTAYKGKVLTIRGNTAMVQPLNDYMAVGGGKETSSPVSAIIPPNIKYKVQNITYMASETDKKMVAVLVPDSLAVGDIVFVGVCDRDISNNPTNRHHNINDGVILRVL